MVHLLSPGDSCCGDPEIVEFYLGEIFTAFGFIPYMLVLVPGADNTPLSFNGNSAGFGAGDTSTGGFGSLARVIRAPDGSRIFDFDGRIELNTMTEDVIGQIPFGPLDIGDSETLTVTSGIADVSFQLTRIDLPTHDFGPATQPTAHAQYNPFYIQEGRGVEITGSVNITGGLRTATFVIRSNSVARDATINDNNHSGSFGTLLFQRSVARIPGGNSFSLRTTQVLGPGTFPGSLRYEFEYSDDQTNQLISLDLHPYEYASVTIGESPPAPPSITSRPISITYFDLP